MDDLSALIRDIPDFPKKGIIFKDITTLLADPAGFKRAVDALMAPFKEAGVTVVGGIESRGFIFGAPIALALSVPFVLFRKPGKLPYETVSATYELEYGTDSVEVHTDSFKEVDKVLLVDDLLATGGTMAACAQLVETLGAEVAGCTFVIELSFLGGRDKLGGYKINALINYSGE